MTTIEGSALKLPEFIRWKIPVKYEKQRIDSAALHRISCSCVGALSSVALFRCIFSFGTFFGFIRVYTVVFSDPLKMEKSSLSSYCGFCKTFEYITAEIYSRLFFYWRKAWQ